MESILAELQFMKQRFDGNSLIDIFMVAVVIFFILKLLTDTHSSSTVRGFIIAAMALGFLSLFKNLTAFSWMVSNALPAFLIMIPIVFAPEIRKLFERVGRMESFGQLLSDGPQNTENMYNAIDVLVKAADSLSSHNTGALIVMEYRDNLDKYVESGVVIDTAMRVEMLLQIFYPNTPLHDGAVIIRNGRIHAASCVMPLTSKNFVERTPEKHMGLRHRAGLGISEEADCPVIIISEETGTISFARNGEITRNITPEDLKNRLQELYHTPEQMSFGQTVRSITRGWAGKTGWKRG